MADFRGWADDSPVGHGSWIPPLQADEHVLWEGRPSLRPFALRAFDLYLVPFSLLWSGIVLRSTVFVWSGGSGPGGLVFLPFTLMALYLLVGRFAHNWFLRSNTYYAVTTRRALIRKGGIFDRAVVERYIDRHEQIESRIQRNGRGTIKFGEARSGFFSRRRNGSELYSTGVEGFQFWKIADGENVLGAIRSVQERSVNREQMSRGPRPGAGSQAPTPSNAPQVWQPDDRDDDGTWNRFGPDVTDRF